MKCPKCRAEDNTVIDTRKYNTVISRVRLCKKCQHIFSTKENIDSDFSHSGYNKRSNNQPDDQCELFDPMEEN